MGKRKWDIENINEYLLGVKDTWMDLRLLTKEYKNTKIKMKFIDEFGYVYFANMDTILDAIKRNYKLLRFGNRNPYTINNIRLFLKLHNVPLKLKDGQQYVNNKTKLCFIKEDNIEVWRNWVSIQQTVLQGCEVTFYKNRTPNSYKQEVFDLTNGEYEVVGDYLTNKIPILHRHNVCGCEWNVSPGSFINLKTRCRECRGIIDTKERMNEILNEVSNGEYTIIGDFTYKKYKTLVRHNTCGHEWYVTINNLLYYSFCPNCVSSKGEKTIDRYLTDNNIWFIPQYRFDNCRSKYPLPFDFYLPYYNLCIEFQGIQHFAPQRFGGIGEKESEALFQYTKQNDKIKKDFCKNNNINFLEITYEQMKDVTNILDDTLTSLNKREVVA